MKKRSRPARTAKARYRLVSLDGATVAEYWPAAWPPRDLSTHLKRLKTPVRSEVSKILVGVPGPWWRGITPVSLPGTIAFVQRLRAHEPERQAAGAAWRKRDKQIRSIANRVRALPFFKRVLYLPFFELEQKDKDTMLAILERQRDTLGRLKPTVTLRAPRARGETDHSALRWLAPQAAAIVASLRAHDAGSELDACARAARILSLASGQRITTSMVKDRVWRLRLDK